MAKLGDIKGIKPKHKAKLKKAKVYSIEALRKRAATPKGIKELQLNIGIDKEVIKDWANRADLLQIDGIGSGYSDLLVKAGIRNVSKLANHEPEQLHVTLAKKNSSLGNQVSRLPGQDQLKAWVRQAQVLSASEPAGPGGGRPGGGRNKLTDF